MGTAKVIGLEIDDIVREAKLLIDDNNEYTKWPTI